MKAIRTIRTYAPRTLSTLEAKELIGKSLFTCKISYKISGKRASKADFEKTIESSSVKVIMTKKLNLYCMGDGNEETKRQLIFDAVIDNSEKPTNTEETKEVTEVKQRIAKAERGHSECYYYINGCIISKYNFLDWISENPFSIEYKQEKADSVDAFGNPTYIQIYSFYAKLATEEQKPKEIAMKPYQKRPVSPEEEMRGKTVYFEPETSEETKSITSYKADIRKLENMKALYRKTSNLTGAFHSYMMEEIDFQIKHCKDCIQNLKKQ